MIKKAAANSIIQFVSTLVVAMVLMIWGTMNLVINVMDMTQGEPGRDWHLGIGFSIVFALLPFLIGAFIAAKQLRQ